MNNQRGLTPIVIVLIIVTLLVGGFLAWQQLGAPKESEVPEELPLMDEKWTEPVTSEASGVEWPGVITSINAVDKVIKMIRMPGGTPNITVFLSNSTIIKDESDNTFTFSNLKLGDVISVSGEYQMSDKFTDKWEVRMHKTDGVVFLGECIKEGKEIIQALQCCTGLTFVDGKYCTKCGDLICKPPENQENCPLDCTKIGENVTITLTIDVESFDLVNKTFEGITSPENQKVKVETTDSTKFYSKAAGTEMEMDNFTFSEFHSLLENWIGPMRFFTTKGFLEKEGVIKADEVFYFVQ